jgi:Tfp pilus assembly protein FimT
MGRDFMDWGNRSIKAIDLTARPAGAATPRRQRLVSGRGSLLLDLVFAAAVTGVLVAIGVPTISTALRTYRLVGSARAISHELALARMQAAARFTRARLTANLTSGTFQVEVCTAKGVTTCTTFTPDGGTRYLASGTRFGYGAITIPAGTQPAIGQSTSITINSRGIPVDGTGAPTGTGALYVTNDAGEYCAVTISASSNVTIWKYTNGSWVGL